MKNGSFSQLAAGAMAGLLPFCPLLSSAQSLSGQTVAGVFSVNGQSRFQEAGDHVEYKYSADNWLYGDAATGQLKLDAYSGINNGNKFDDWQASVAYHAVLTNTGVESQAFALSFPIRQGSVVAATADPFIYTGVAKLDGKVLVDGKEVWSTSAKCGSGNGCSFVGADIGYVKTSLGYQFADYFGSAPLGVLKAGESVAIDYSLSSDARSSGFASAYASVGSFSDSNGFGVTVSAVPEPMPTTLFLSGMMLLAVKSRRQKSAKSGLAD